MKKIISVVLTAALSAVLFTACGTEQTQNRDKQESAAASKDTAEKSSAENSSAEKAAKYPDTHPLYFKDSAKSDKAVATFFNSVSGKSEEVEMKKTGEDKDSRTFSCEGNCSAYNMAYITCGGKKTREFAFNPCVSGWYKKEDDLLPYVEGEKIDYTPKYEKITLTGHGYKKNIYIWTPDGYDASAAEKYSTVYVIDGQFLTYIGEYGQVLNDCAIAVDQVKAMNSVSDTKAIVVAIDNVGTRDYELIPDIGDSVLEKDFESRNGTPYEDEFDSMDGTQFADFVAKTLVPYVQQHYNVYTDTLHTAIVGASLGGGESFYIAAEYPEIFGTGGALSPSFWTFESEVWDEYLGKKSFDNNSPFIYLYTGSDDDDVGPGVKEMYDRLIKMGYPEEKLVFHYNEEGAHGGIFWRCIFSEFLTAMVYRDVKPLR